MRLLTALLALAVLAVAPASAQATINLVSPIPFSAVEGERIDQDQFLARYTDSNACAAGAQTITVAWGDGTTSAGEIERTEQLPVGGCNYFVVGDHEYRAAGTYALTVTACGADNCVTSPPAVVVVTPAAMKGEALAIRPLSSQQFTGEVAEFNSDNRLSQPSDFTAVVDWGDGTTSAGIIGGKDGRFDVTGQHVYANPGSYVMSVRLVQNGATRVTSDPATVVVGDGAPGAGTRIVAQNPAFAVAGSSRLRPALRLRTSSIRRRSLSKGLPVRVIAPSITTVLRVDVVRIGSPSRTLGRATLRLRGGTISDGMRIANLRVSLSPALRRRMRAGRYELRFRVGNSGLVRARFRVS